jgi:hypothetical protein
MILTVCPSHDVGIDVDPICQRLVSFSNKFRIRCHRFHPFAWNCLARCCTTCRCPDGLYDHHRTLVLATSQRCVLCRPWEKQKRGSGRDMRAIVEPKTQADERVETWFGFRSRVDGRHWGGKPDRALARVQSGQAGAGGSGNGRAGSTSTYTQFNLAVTSICSHSISVPWRGRPLLQPLPGLLLLALVAAPWPSLGSVSVRGG